MDQWISEQAPVIKLDKSGLRLYLNEGKAPAKYLLKTLTRVGYMIYHQ